MFFSIQVAHSRGVGTFGTSKMETNADKADAQAWHSSPFGTEPLERPKGVIRQPFTVPLSQKLHDMYLPSLSTKWPQ